MATVRVLIVEDDARVGRLLRTIVERDGHEAVTAEDGETATRLLAEHPLPDVMILDRMLPDADGVDLLDRLRAEDHTAGLPVLLLTPAISQPADLPEGPLLRLLAKPFDLFELRHLLAELTTS